MQIARILQNVHLPEEFCGGHAAAREMKLPVSCPDVEVHIHYRLGNGAGDFANVELLRIQLCPYHSFSAS